MVDFIATRVAYRDRSAALAADTCRAGIARTGAGIADTGKRTSLGMTLTSTGAP